MPGSGWRRSLDLVPGLSWTRGMLLYARLSGLMLGNVPGHVLSHVCGHVRSMCPVLGMQYLNEQVAHKRGVAGPKKWRPEVIIANMAAL